MSAPIEYIPGFITDPDAAFAELLTLDFERRDTTPRSEYFCSDYPDPYSYGRGRGIRTYSPRPYHPRILSVRADLEKRFGCVLDVCFINRYHDQSDHLGWHADDSPEMDDLRPIITVSLGAVREIWFRPIPDKAATGGSPATEKLTLEHGSACVMLPHMQESWEHRIPKASSTCGERLSMVYRGYVR